jgi:hypothetical protein
MSATLAKEAGAESSAPLPPAETGLRPAVFIIPGANPSPRQPEASRNLIIAPTDQEQTVRLDDEFRSRIGVIDQDIRSITPGSDFTVLERDRRSPLAFIVASGGANVIAANLSRLLTASPHIVKLLPQLERVWVPLLGMEASGLSYEQSLQAILDGIAGAETALSRQREDRPRRFIIATSAQIDLATLIRLRWIAESWAGRTPADLSGALAALQLSMDGEAMAVLGLAADLALAQRPPMDNGEMGTRSLLFALGGSWPHFSAGFAPTTAAFARALTELAGIRRLETQNFYFANAAQLADHEASPIVFESDLVAVMQAAARSADSGVVGVAPLANALLDRCEAPLPRPIHARRALERMGVAPTQLRQAFADQLRRVLDFTIAYAPLGNDSTDQTNLDDKLGAEVEACAFARVAAARDVSPPLAFGIFGDWGSGKSFFMRLMYRHVERLQAHNQAFIDQLLANLRIAAEGTEHDVLLKNARALGGIIDAAGVSREQAVELLLKALPETVKDRENARQTALAGLRDGQAGAPEAASGLFHRNIVQIRFNAWHYAETELWASLVENIFSELDRWMLARTQTEKRNALFDNLATARELTLESAERLLRRREEQRAATRRLAEAERNLAAAHETAGATPRAFWDAVLAAFYQTVSRQELEAAAITAGLGDLSEEAEGLKRSLDSLRDDARRGRLEASGLARRLIAAPSLILLGGLILLLPAGLLELRDWLVGQPWLWSWMHGLIGEIHGVALGVSGVLASAAAVLSVAGRQVRTAIGKLEGFRKRLDKAVENQLKPPADEVKKAQSSLARLKADILEAQSLLAASSDRVAEAAREYETGTGRARLLRFVRERVTNGDYARHLGLIATIRKDFTQLSDLMVGRADTALREEAVRQVKAYRRQVLALIRTGREQKLMARQEIWTLLQSAKTLPVTGSDGAGPVFDRIILYIDDLDRCEPRKVVDVLQAVHLLLTFPLFIVVVAVDVRWVSRSLEKHYNELIGAAESATAVDYLEKIFQVPYWVRPMTPDGSRKLLGDLATRRAYGPSGAEPPATPSGTDQDQDPEEQVPHGDSETAGGPRTDATTVPATKAGNGEETPDPEKVGQNEPRSRRAEPLGRGLDPGQVANETRARIVARALELTKGERAFMLALAPFAASTPRRVLRFLNVYRVIKASLGPEELEALENRGGYRALMTQLAIATETPDLYRRWLAVLGGIAAAGIASEAQARLKAGLKEAGWTESLDAHDRIPSALDLFWSEALPDESRSTHEAVQNRGLELLSEHGNLARRYSFSD